jgi:hypothetical protein
MSKVVDYIIEKLKEPSTWRGIVWLATAFGFAFEPEQKEAIAAFGMTLAGLISVFIEKGNTHEEALRYAEMYGATQHTGRFSHKIGLYDRDTDRTTRWMCPECKHTWGR